MSIFLSQPHPFATATNAIPPASPSQRTVYPASSQAIPETEPLHGRPLSSQSGDGAKEDGGVWRFEIQNEDSIGIDVFEKPMDHFFPEKVESGHLTWGWRVSYTPNTPNPDWFENVRDDLFWPAGRWKARASYSLQQSAYTPNTYSAEDKLADRPWAGYLMANARLNLERDFNGSSQYLDRINLGLGLVGPASGGEVTHKFFHNIRDRSSRTWNELNSEPVAILQYDTGKRWVWGNDYLAAEAYPYTGVTLGNAYTYASLGFSARVGSNLKKDSGPLRSNMIMSGTNFPQTGNYFSWNLFAGIEGRYVGRNIFVDGNTFSDTSDVESKHKVMDIQMGGEIGWGANRFSLVHVYRSEEFSGQISPDQFLRAGLSSDFSSIDFRKSAKQKEGPLWGVVSELRLGLLSHDIRFPSRHKFHAPNPFDNRYEGGVNLNPEVVFISPDALKLIGSPRPHIGVSINADDNTNSAYTGLGWDANWQSGVFLGGFFGIAVHDGKLTNGNPDRIEFGSRALFRLGGELGWRWDDVNGVSLIWEHMSNAGLLNEKNQGIDSLGIRYSYRFD